MLRIGLTGGIGSGKTTVANHFSSLGIHIIDADEIVHQISTPGHRAFDAIIQHFGVDVLNSDGTLNRLELGHRVFTDTEERKALESILHPAVRIAMQQEMKESDSPYCILVIPLLVETGYTDLVDRVLVVTADREKRMAWVKRRNGLSDTQIESIMAAQASDEERDRIADDVIENNGSLDSLFKQVEDLDRKYRLNT
ncbi:dephospho-CoA kinase [Pseudomonadota bacterium]